MPLVYRGSSAANDDILQLASHGQFPEVERVFGKVGRAETVTDPARLEIFETTIRFKPRSEWPNGKTQDELIEEMNAALQIPGLSNLLVQPIRNGIDMLSTGIKSPVGIKIAGPELKIIEKLGEQVEATVKQMPERGTCSRRDVTSKFGLSACAPPASV
jgi:copper/silver efflux system protein